MDRAADRVEILELSARYIQAIDAYDVDACLATLTDDGHVEVPTGRHDREELAANLRQLRDLGGRYRHLTTQSVIEIDGDEATQRSYFLFLDLADGATALANSGTYDDRLRRTPDGWRFVSRRTTLDAPWALTLPGAEREAP
ncbi:MAG: nuclear transport factor 2 family protein [Solirubrobacteraceae bacterium]